MNWMDDVVKLWKAQFPQLRNYNTRFICLKATPLLIGLHFDKLPFSDDYQVYLRLVRLWGTSEGLIRNSIYRNALKTEGCRNFSIDARYHDYFFTRAVSLTHSQFDTFLSHEINIGDILKLIDTKTNMKPLVWEILNRFELKVALASYFEMRHFLDETFGKIDHQIINWKSHGIYGTNECTFDEWRKDLQRKYISGRHKFLETIEGNLLSLKVSKLPTSQIINFGEIEANSRSSVSIFWDSLSKTTHKIKTQLLTIVPPMIGDIYYVKSSDNRKHYFQYVGKDLSQFSTPIIRVFSKSYKSGQIPNIIELWKSGTAFYSHTYIENGVKLGLWHRLCNWPRIDYDELEKTLFASANTSEKIDGLSFKIVDPKCNWFVWGVNENHTRVGELPKELRSSVELGNIYACRTVRERIISGYYNNTSIEYDVIKREPYPYVDSYTKLNSKGDTHYLHFLGADAVEELVVENGQQTKLTLERPEANGRKLRTAKFWKTNWKYYEFITKEEFDAAWNAR